MQGAPASLPAELPFAAQSASITMGRLLLTTTDYYYCYYYYYYY